MSFIKTVCRKTGYFILSIIRFLRRTLCCRRKRRESGMLLPITVNYSLPMKNEAPDLHDWNSWGESEHNSASNSTSSTVEHRLSNEGEIGNKQCEQPEEDFFKDMVPQFRKPKKLIIKDFQDSIEVSGHTNRLAMDTRAFPILDAELGLIEDHPSEWSEMEDLGEKWDADSLIREKKMADREKRIAEHQKRKLERESKHSNKLPSIPAVNPFYVSETNERTKYS